MSGIAHKPLVLQAAIFKITDEVKLYTRAFAPMAQRNIALTNALPVPGSRDVGGGDASTFTDERMGGAIFTLDGIKFGLKICLDHLKALIPQGTGIAVQLVPSAGASLKQFACVAGGIAFNVDGGTTARSDVRVNDAGATPVLSTAPAKTSHPVADGGKIELYEIKPLP